MKRLLIKLTGLMLTAAIVLSASGTALALENEEPAGDVGVTSEEPAADPAPAAEAPAAEEPDGEKKPAEDKKETVAEEPAAEEPAENKEEPAADPEQKKEESAEDPKVETKKGDESQDKGGSKTEIHEKKYVDVKFDYDNNELAEAYINRAFGKNTSTRKSSYNYVSYTGKSLAIYTYLREEVAKIASGEASNTQLTYTFVFTPEDFNLTYFDQDSINNAYDSVTAEFENDLLDMFYTLTQSCPYDLYWFDKGTTGAYAYGTGGRVENEDLIIEVYIDLKVAKEYRLTKNDEYTVNTALYGSLVQIALNNASAIISSYAGLDDYKKLKAYKNKICELTDYNDPAAHNGDVPYGNPWQMIWVFDGDPETTVVCEGYSKAFQYLCDNSTFRSDEIYALSVTGNCNGAHMWNVVHMDDGNYYLVDVTNCDPGWTLFLKGYNSHPNSTTYTISAGNDTLFTYIYDGTSIAPELADHDYEHSTEKPSFATHGMVLASKIGLRFVVSFPENYNGENCYVEFRSSTGKTSRVNFSESEINAEDETKRYFTFYMNAVELADTVTATLHYGNNETKTDCYSAMSYIQDMKNSSYKEDYWLMNLLYKLQAYGYYMQRSGWSDNYTHIDIPVPSYISNKEENIPETIISDGDIAETITQVNSYGLTNSSNSIIADVKVALTLNTQTELRISVKPADGVTIESDASEYTIREINNETYYQFTIKDIGPKKLAETKTLTVETSQGTVTIGVSVMYYVRQILSSNQFENKYKYAMVAYYNYYHAAVNYKKQ